MKIREAVLADAIEKNVVAFAHISMRLRIELAPGGVQTDFLFWGLLSLHELGYFPFTNADPTGCPRAMAKARRSLGIHRRWLNARSLDEKVRATLASRHTGSTR